MLPNAYNTGIGLKNIFKEYNFMKKHTKNFLNRYLVYLLVTALAISILGGIPLSVLADELQDKAENITYLQIDELREISAEAVLRQAVFNAGTVPSVIYLLQDIALTTNYGYPGTLVIPQGSDITFRGSGSAMHNLIVGIGGSAITVTEGAQLTIDGVGVRRLSGRPGTGIVNNGSLTLILGDITGHDGAGVSNRGVFVMHGGRIYGNTSGDQNYGGGVINSGVFEIHGGEISRNMASSVGGGIFNNSGSFVPGHFTRGIINMYGGKISGNSATIGGGMWNGGIFNMHGGEISGNSAESGNAPSGGGIFNWYAGSFLRSGGVVNMHDGKISGNFAGSGGGIYSQSIVNIYGGEISENIAHFNGGGIGTSHYSGIVNMHGGKISGNIAQQSDGGGVSNSALSHFNMHCGEISGNFARLDGGGVRNVSPSTFNMHGGEISGNIATNGGGIGIDPEGLRGGEFFVGAGAIFAENYATNGAFNRNPADDGIYATYVHGSRWTVPFTQGLNNFDISANRLGGDMVVLPMMPVFTGSNPSTLDTMLGEGDVTLSTPGNLGIFAHHGPLLIPAGRTLVVTTALNIQRDAELIIEGTLIVSEGARINNQGSAAGGGTIVIAGSGELVNYGHVENVTNSAVVNYGTIVNNGRFEVRAGTVFHNCGVVEGALNIHRNAIMVSCGGCETP